MIEAQWHNFPLTILCSIVFGGLAVEAPEIAGAILRSGCDRFTETTFELRSITLADQVCSGIQHGGQHHQKQTVGTTTNNVYTYPTPGQAQPNAVSQVNGVINGVTNPPLSTTMTTVTWSAAQAEP